MKKSFNKLSLNKTTISNLNTITMNELLGGGQKNARAYTIKPKLSIPPFCLPPPPQTKVCL